MNLQNPQEDWSQEQEPGKGAGMLRAAALVLVGLAMLMAAGILCVYFLVHIPTEATCTQDSVCKICGKVMEDALGHDWQAADCGHPKICARCDDRRGDALDHDWKAADCEHAKTCKQCGETQGEPLGHSWAEAGCESPKTCRTCGAVQGQPAGHDWTDADCEHAKTCKQCGETQGDSLGHNWTAATYTAPKTCTRCGKTEGEPLPREEDLQPDPDTTEPETDTTEPEQEPVPQVDVEQQVLRIREQYNAIVEKRNSGGYRKVILDNGAAAYYDASGSLCCLEVYRGIAGIGADSTVYSRSYYFSNGVLFFAFFEGNDAHRLYFYDGALMRWRYTWGEHAVNHDYTFTQEYRMWESLALEEAQQYLNNP